MKVKRTSWHYWLWKFGRNEKSEPKDLCRYFWHIVLIKLALPLAIVGFVLLGIGALMWVIYGHPVFTGIVILGALLVAGLLIGLVFLIERLNERKAYKRAEARRNPQPPREPGPTRVWFGLLRQYLAARKRKICPLIEVIDDREAA